MRLVERDGIIGILRQGGVANLDSDRSLIQRQAFGHGIVQNIAHSALIGLNGGFELYCIADLGGIFIAKIASGIFLDFLLNGGLGVLLVMVTSGVLVSNAQREPRELVTK